MRGPAGCSTGVMAHASHSARMLLALAAGLLSARNAAADKAGGERERAVAARASISQPRARGGDGDHDWRALVPARCAPFTAGFGEPGSREPGSEHAWRELLSLATCLQDASVERVSEPAELLPMVEAMSRRLALPMKIYLAALERGDAPVQLRATFQIGMAYVALATRARSSIAAPGPGADAERRHRELHARLEPLLVPARRAAWIAFNAIGEAAEEDRALARNEIERGMIRAARELLPALRDAAPGAERRTLLVMAAAAGAAR
jgi:hypothetical protein